MHLRPATRHDAEPLRTIFREASLGNTHDREALLAHPEHLVWDPAAINTETVLVVEDAGRVIGFATAVGAGPTWELDDLFVAPSAQRRGAATLLVAGLVKLARERGVNAIVVTANPQALAFYTSAGFVETGQVVTTFGAAPRMRRFV